VSPEAFPIIHPKIRLEIRLEKLKNLRVHEEVIPDVLRRITEDIRADGYFKHPVIVDSETLIVLDGIHRVVAAKNLRCRFIPVCLVDYNNPNINVGYWCRVINHSSDFRKLLQLVRELGFTVEELQREKVQKLVNERMATTAIISRKKCFALYGPQKNIIEIYNAINQIESKLRSESYSINYEIESDALEKVSSGKTLSILITPVVSKKDIVAAVLSRKVFTHKATRHLIPARPLFVNVPLELLQGKLGFNKANENFVGNLFKKQIIRLPPGQIFDRRYEEEIYVFK
jgi:uncharacterized protein YwgA